MQSDSLPVSVLELSRRAEKVVGYRWRQGYSPARTRPGQAASAAAMDQRLTRLPATRSQGTCAAVTTTVVPSSTIEHVTGSPKPFFAPKVFEKVPSLSVKEIDVTT